MDKVTEQSKDFSPNREISKEFQDTNYINNHLKWKVHVEDQMRREKALLDAKEALDISKDEHKLGISSFMSLMKSDSKSRFGRSRKDESKEPEASIVEESKNFLSPIQRHPSFSPITLDVKATQP